MVLWGSRATAATARAPPRTRPRRVATAGPTGDGAGCPGRDRRCAWVTSGAGPGAAVRVRRAVQTIMNVLAVAVRLVAWLFAVVLLVRIGLAFVAVNPHNVIVEWIVRFADVLVWGFRDLFLPADPQYRAGGELRSGRGVLGGRRGDRRLGPVRSRAAGRRPQRILTALVQAPTDADGVRAALWAEGAGAGSATWWRGGRRRVPVRSATAPRRAGR